MTARSEAKAAAAAIGAKRYIGAVCETHPELGGERNVRSRGCIACNKDTMRRLRADKPQYYKKQSQGHYLKNREEVLRRTRERQLRELGFTVDLYEKVFAAQGGKCPICGDAMFGRNAHADHCHDTNQPRGILCGNCNRAEGMIRRARLTPKEFANRLSDYLANPPARKFDQ